jgi:hypothetical protein
MKIDADMEASGLCKIQAIPAISHENTGIKNNKRPLISARRLYRFLKGHNNIQRLPAVDRPVSKNFLRTFKRTVCFGFLEFCPQEKSVPKKQLFILFFFSF